MTAVAPRLGAWPVAGEGVEFRVWAPDAGTVALCLQGVLRPMHRDPDGCHWLRTQASHGDRYRFRLPSGQDVPTRPRAGSRTASTATARWCWIRRQRGLPGTGMPGRTW